MVMMGQAVSKCVVSCEALHSEDGAGTGVANHDRNSIINIEKEIDLSNLAILSFCL